ncbi:MAG: SAM-dependent methyltransferase [Devosia sp.]
MSTARGVALVRAMEMARPESERISSDPYAASFVNPVSLHGVRLMSALGVLGLIGVEPMLNFAIVRERYVHDLIIAEAKAGLDQIVILGAGFDTRTYRIAEIAAVPVYEVDHPVTQAQKRKALRAVVDPLPANVKFVGVDFETDDLGVQLAAAGYREEKRTLFVWQGVTMYLTSDGIDRTLAFVAQHSASGSVVVFDYFVAADISSGEARTIRFFTGMMGEAVTFSIDSGKIGPFLESRGFTDVRNAGPAEMARPYLTGPNAKRPMANGVAVVSARVK